MSGYRFGVALSSARRTLPRLVALAQQAERAGLDFVSFQDHLYNPHWVDTWTLLTAVGAQTSRIGLQIATATLPLRYPPVLAKQAMTLDLLTGGRLELGIGSGGPQYADGIRSLGIDPPSGARAVQLVEEAIGVLRALWESGPDITSEPADQLGRIQRNYDDYLLPRDWPAVTLRGTLLHLDEAFRGPAPAHHIPILVGATRPRMAAVAGRTDGWVVSYGRLSQDELLALHERIDEAAIGAGKNPATLIRQYNLFGTIGLPGSAHLGPRPGFAGTAAEFAELMVRCCTADRMTAINYWPGDDPEQLSVYATEVVPRVRKLLAAPDSDPAQTGTAGP
jgi:alkanesulfonate monooxygenase SsuD/methylene tetrahydromethanopterin reductase-like flavin-dependent oxidoreductase (luciferase family)